MPLTCASCRLSMPSALFLSDLHLGRGSAAEQAAAERDVLALLRAHEAAMEDEGALFLVGDVFEQYIEYRHLIPKGFFRFQALLAEWTDRGIPVLYLTGNRDPWHLDHFERELGVRVLPEAWEGDVHGLPTYIAHGDAHLAGTPLAARFRSLVRSPFMARLYRMSVPGDTGYAFARWFSLRFGSGGAVDPPSADRLHAWALTRLAESEAQLIVLGHIHQATCISAPDGTYLNPGYWFADRTFGRLDVSSEGTHRVRLYRWTPSGTEPVAPAVNPTAFSRVEADAPSL